MATHLWLSNADRERLGAPEELIIDFDTLTQVEAEILDDHGVDADHLNSYLANRPAVGPDGKPLLDADGEQYLSLPIKGMRIAVWLGLRRAGIELPFDGFDFQRHALRLRVDIPKEETSPPTESPSAT